jgi:hypothetical protein
MNRIPRGTPRRLLRRHGYNRLSRAEGRSSIGRAPVSKTGGCRFESCRPCSVPPRCFLGSRRRVAITYGQPSGETWHPLRDAAGARAIVHCGKPCRPVLAPQLRRLPGRRILGTRRDCRGGGPGAGRRRRARRSPARLVAVGRRPYLGNARRMGSSVGRHDRARLALATRARPEATPHRTASGCAGTGTRAPAQACRHQRRRRDRSGASIRRSGRARRCDRDPPPARGGGNGAARFDGTRPATRARYMARCKERRVGSAADRTRLRV